MALVAVETHAKEQLRGVFHGCAGIAQDFEIAGLRIGHIGTATSEDFTHELVVRFAIGNRLVDVFAEGTGTRVAQKLPVDLQQVGPLVGHVLDIGRAAYKLVDNGIAFHACRACIGQERAHIFSLWQQACEVQMHPADEFRVVAKIGGLDLQVAQTGINQGVDFVMNRRVGPHEAGAIAHHDQACGCVVPFVANKHSRLTPAECRHNGLTIDRGYLGIAAFKKRFRSHVAFVAIGERGHDFGLLLLAGQGNRAAFGSDFNLRHAGCLGVELGASSNPTTQEFVIAFAGLC